MTCEGEYGREVLQEKESVRIMEPACRSDRKSPSLSSALAEIDVLWITVWRIHATEGNPTGCMGLPDYLGWQWRSRVGIPMR